MKRITLLALISIAIVLPNLSGYERVDGRDTGIFSYIGEKLVSGKALYRDAWDSKGPSIFYVYALGIALGNHSPWGFGLLNALFIFAASLSGEAALRRTFGRRAAEFGTWGWLAGLLILSSSLNVEMVALPFGFAAYYLYVRWQDDKGAWWYGVLIGATGAMGFLSRANNVGAQVAIGLLVLTYGVRSREWRSTLVKMLALLVGAAIPLCLVAAYFASQNTLLDMIDASLVYNLAYSNTTILLRIRSVLYGIVLLSGVSILTMTGLVFARMHGLRTRLQPDQIDLLVLGVVDLTVEVVFATLSGRDYGHYYIAWLPAIAILIGFCGFVLVKEHAFLEEQLHALGSIALFKIQLLPSSFMHHLLDWASSLIRNPSYALLGLSALLVLNGMYFRYPRMLRSFMPDPNQPIVDFIETHTKPGDYVLMWSAEIGYNYLTERPSPGRYTNLYPLFTQGYQTPTMVTQLLDEIVVEKPLIIDCSSSDGLSPPIDDVQRQLWSPNVASWGLIPEMDEVFKYIHAHYQRVGVIGPNDWSVYVDADN
jgi:4-amino-4-deoxy-L-arabinose transferase-like glycosyltransferase